MFWSFDYLLYLALLLALFVAGISGIVYPIWIWKKHSKVVQGDVIEVPCPTKRKT